MNNIISLNMFGLYSRTVDSRLRVESRVITMFHLARIYYIIDVNTFTNIP